MSFLTALRTVNHFPALAAQGHPFALRKAVRAIHNMEEFSAKALFAKIHRQDSDDLNLETFQPKPIPLITVDEGGNLVLDPEGENLLKNIPGKISIVSVCGQARSGKSALCNLLVSNSGQGFKLSHDFSYSTAGIWLWGVPISTKDTQIFFLDCQATNELEKCPKSDMILYALTVLLSSVIVFNSKGVIDEEAIKQLNLLMCFSDAIDFTMEYGNSTEEIEERVGAEIPKFVWVLRDFQIAILDDNDNCLPPKEYMESLLNMPSFMGAHARNNEKTLHSFLKIFRDRDCFTLPRPTKKESDLKIFERVGLEGLRSQFLEEFNKFKISILENCPIKKINGSEVTGFQLITVTQQTIELVNNEELPNFYEVVDFAARLQYEEVLHKAKQRFALSKRLDLAKMPFEELEIIDNLQQAKEASLSMFTSIKPKNPDIEIEMLENFLEFFQECLKAILKANYAASEAFNISLLETLYRDIIIKVDEGYYSDNFEELETDWIRTIYVYEKQAKGPGRFSALTEFSKTHQHGAFNRFFEEIKEKNFEEIEALRQNGRENEEKLKNQRKNEARQEIINGHVSNI